MVKKIKIIRVLPDEEFFEWLMLTIPEELVTAKFDDSDLYDIKQEIPTWSDTPAMLKTQERGW